MKPFLKWAGNKYSIVERIRAQLPDGQRLIEPFVGSGALFLNADFPAYLLADANPDLIGLYCFVRDEGDEFIGYCHTFFSTAGNSRECFDERRRAFNSTNDPRHKAALFLYLNRHCFNGLCRYNRKGEFNVPFGRYKKPYFPERELHFFHERAQRAELHCQGFVKTMNAARSGDVIYCDPPYVPLSETANFTSYSAGAFGRVEQEALVQQAERCAARGITVLISNHDTPFVRELYANASELTSFSVRRTISRDGANRTPAAEVLALFSR